MRTAIVAILICLAPAPMRADDKQITSQDLDKQLFDVLKEVHNRGADLFNAGDAIGCYKLFQGCLQTTRAVLAYRPDEQKYIDDMLAEAELLTTVPLRAYSLHGSIEKLRLRLRPVVLGGADGKRPEVIPTPRESKEEKKESPKLVVPPKDGVMGRLLWQGTPVAGAVIKFVADAPSTVRIEGTSAEDGQYRLEKVPPGKYTVLLAMPMGKKPALPIRYADPAASPLFVDVKGGGDTLDFLLQ